MDKRYWRSVDELADTPEFRRFLESEFPNLAVGMSASTRRQFLKIMGASFALAGMAGCRWPKETIAPYAKRPRGRTPGVPVYYATAMDLGGFATALLAKSYDGRPIKIEGNPDHPSSLGGTLAIHQASVLELYDPDRSFSPRKRGKRVKWATALEALRSAVRATDAERGVGLAVLADASSSPVRAAARKRFQAKYPNAMWFEYEPIGWENQREGTRIAFGRPMQPLIDFSRTDTIVSFDDDFLLDHPMAVAYTRGFARRRTADDGQMNRLIQIESQVSLTGSNADDRFVERSADIGVRLCQLGAELAKAGLHLPDQAAQLLRGFDLGSKQPAYLAEVAVDLMAHKGRSVITVGPRQAPEVHAVAALLNHALGSAGKAVTYVEAADADRPTHLAAIRKLAKHIEQGHVSTLVILGGNPAYDAPVDLNMTERIGRVEHSFHVSLYNDETSRACAWHLPRTHYLESWDLARAWDGSLAIVQPLIVPLYDGRTDSEILSWMAGEPKTTAFKLTQAVYAKQYHRSGDLNKDWRKALRTGRVPGADLKKMAPEPTAADWDAVFAVLRGWEPAAAESDAFEVVFVADKLYDGRFANNGWLQELPHPLTKLTWDNAAIMSPVDAERLGIRQGDMVEITVGERRLRIPAFVLPGQAPGSITLPLGYGRKQAGAVAKGAGVDTYAVRQSSAMHIDRRARLRKAGGKRQLATTQDHHSIESEVGNEETQKRIPRLVREGTLGQYKRDPHFVAHLAHSLPLLQPFGSHEFPDKPHWAMAIDLAKCTGCSACVTACQAENNIPVVGKREVIMGREMHWIRVDRYFKGDPADSGSIEVRYQPVTCVQCENAPCEQVCPVAATVHDEEGLNVMVYNRCIGTRYCLNNCPYKVRRFNWFYNQHGPYHPRSGGEWRQAELYEVEKLVFNPEVTVRTRGVMEKCSYCVQRISAAKIAARNAQVQGRGDGEIPDGSLMTACQQACPADAIVFGDLRNKNSRVARAHASNRAYTMLEDLNIRTRGKYLAGLTNPLHEAAPEAEGHEKPHEAHKPGEHA